MSVVGLDFGNQNAVIAAAGRGGVDVILNGNSQRLNPCMVGFNDSRSMGEAAQSTATSNFRNTIKSIKHLIGLPFDDPRAKEEMKRCAFECVPFPHPGSSTVDSIAVKVTFNSEEKIVPVEAVAGMMVKHMGSLAAEKAAESSTTPVNTSTPFTDPANPLFPKDWVIAVPGYYTDSQKRAFITGCEIAGVQVSRLMHDHTATALAYGIFKDIRKEFTKDKPNNVMFLDLGASTYSCSIVSFEPGKLIVKSAQHDPILGGRDFDLAIAEWIAAKFEEKFGSKLSDKPMNRPKVMLKLLAAAEKAKKTLSPAGVKETRISLECLMDDLDFNCVLKASEYEEMCAPLLARLKGPIERALAETGLSAGDMSSVEIVGGGSRVGCVKRELATVLGLNIKDINNGLSTTMNADEAIARGAALQSAILSPRFKVLPYEIIEHQPFPVKISWDGDASGTSAAKEGVEVAGEVEGSNDLPSNSVVMFDRGSNFNCVRRVTLRRAGEFTVSASYDDSSDKYDFPAGVSKDICIFKIKAPEGTENKVRVNVKQDLHGSILLSSAQMVEEVIEEEEPAPPAKEGDGDKKDDKKEEETKDAKEAKPEKKKKVKKTNLEFSESRPLEWTTEEIAKACEVEKTMSSIDRVVIETAQIRNDLESYIYDMRDKIISESQLAPFGTSEEKNAFSTALEKNENWLYEDGFDATKSVYADKLKELKAFGDPLEMRKSESEERPQAISVLQRTLEKYGNWLNSCSGDEQYSHLTEEDLTKCREMCDTTSAWMYEMMDKQGSVASNENPIVYAADFNKKSKEVTNLVNPIMHKLKPKPKAEEKKEEEKPAEKKEEEKPAESTTEPMETEDTSAKDESKSEEGEKAAPMETD